MGQPPIVDQNMMRMVSVRRKWRLVFCNAYGEYPCGIK